MLWVHISFDPWREGWCPRSFLSLTNHDISWRKGWLSNFNANTWGLRNSMTGREEPSWIWGLGDTGVTAVRTCRLTLLLLWGSCSSRTCLHPAGSIRHMNDLGSQFPTCLREPQWRLQGSHITAGSGEILWNGPRQMPGSQWEGILSSFCFHGPGKNTPYHVLFTSRQTSGNQMVTYGFRSLGNQVGKCLVQGFTKADKACPCWNPPLQ